LTSSTVCCIRAAGTGKTVCTIFAVFAICAITADATDSAGIASIASRAYATIGAVIADRTIYASNSIKTIAACLADGAVSTIRAVSGYVTWNDGSWHSIRSIGRLTKNSSSSAIAATKSGRCLGCRR
jgi:hypothetical protein